MKIFLTGGSGDLGTALTQQLEKRGDIPIRFDLRKPWDTGGQFITGSILDRAGLSNNLSGIDCIVHIAAWHGYHEFTKQKSVDEFFDLNVTGTVNVFQAALEKGIKNIIFISSESIAEHEGIYGLTKRLGEKIAAYYFCEHHLNILTLRPRAFIPHWNKVVYPSFIDWAKWYWKGAVHIDDVTQAVIQGIDLLKKPLHEHLILPIDGAYEYTHDDLLLWDAAGPGSTFKKHYASFYELVLHYGLDPSIKPSTQDISETKRHLGYQPHYSLKSLLEELSAYGTQGPSQQT